MDGLQIPFHEFSIKQELNQSINQSWMESMAGLLPTASPLSLVELIISSINQSINNGWIHSLLIAFN